MSGRSRGPIRYRHGATVPRDTSANAPSREICAKWIEARIPALWTIVVPKHSARCPRVHVVGGEWSSICATNDPARVNAVLGEFRRQRLLAPHWGAKSYPGQELADALNDLSRGWHVMETFGTNAVLVNYSSATPWGDPAFTVAVLK